MRWQHDAACSLLYLVSIFLSKLFKSHVSSLLAMLPVEFELLGLDSVIV